MPIDIRKPHLADGAAVHDLIQRNPPLDVNSRYLYLLMCSHFAGTCVVAEEEASQIVGAITGYHPPEQPDSLFIWQVAVDEAARGQGLAGRMLDALLDGEAGRGVRYLEATVTPSNQPSRRLFERLAEKRGTFCEQSEFFNAELFGPGEHEEELLLRIGPFND